MNDHLQPIDPSAAQDFATRANGTTIYSIRPGVSIANVRDQLDRRLEQLRGLLSVTYGEPGEAFRSNSDELQDGFMWACFDIAEECRALSQLISRGGDGADRADVSTIATGQP